MAAYSYQALNIEGKKVKGIIEGDSSRHVRDLLRERKLKPLSVDVASSAKNKDTDTISRPIFRRSISTSDLALLTRQLAVLVESGVPLDESLAATAKQTKKSRIKSLILDVRGRVLEGHSLANAMRSAPHVFNDLFQAMVKAGERAGFLGPVLERLADYTESRQQTQQKITQAMIYPIILVFISITVVAVLLVYMVPKLVSMFESQKAELPFLTTVMIQTSDFLRSYGLYLLLAAILCFIAFRVLLRNPQRKKSFHTFLLKVPVISELLRKADTARYANTLSVLMTSGVPLVEAMGISTAVLKNFKIRAASQIATNMVREGSSLRRSLEETDEFPPMMLQMIGSGEASGELENMLGRAAKNQDRELESTINSSLSVLEPIMILLMGGLVLLIIMATLLPIFNFNNLISA